jgi:hypothetical protein
MMGDVGLTATLIEGSIDLKHRYLAKPCRATALMLSNAAASN